MNDEHGASKRNSVLLVLLTMKQMVPTHKNEIIKKIEDHQVRKMSKYEINMIWMINNSVGKKIKG